MKSWPSVFSMLLQYILAVIDGGGGEVLVHQQPVGGFKLGLHVWCGRNSQEVQ